MQAKVREEGEITVVTIRGYLEIEKTQPFREVCTKHLLNKKVIFNMENTSFVGSTGLQPFLDTVQSFIDQNEYGLKVVCKKPEFLRIFQNYNSQKLKIVDSEDKALKAFLNPELVVSELVLESLDEEPVPTFDNDNQSGFDAMAVTSNLQKTNAA